MGCRCSQDSPGHNYNLTKTNKPHLASFNHVATAQLFFVFTIKNASLTYNNNHFIFFSLL